MKDKKKVIIVERRLCVRDTLVNCIPFALSGFLVLFLMFHGLNVLDSMFRDNEMFPLITIVWLLLCIKFVRFIAMPITSYSIEEKYVEGDRL